MKNCLKALLLARLPVPLKLCAMLAAATTLTACAAGRSADLATTQPAAQTSAQTSPQPDQKPGTTAFTGPVVSMSRAVPLEKLEVDDWEPNLLNKLESPLAARTTYFGELDAYSDDADPDTDKPDDAVPIIAVRDSDGSFKALALVGGPLRESGWQFVGAGPHPGEIWGALDVVTDAQHGRFVLAHSTDGGKTFQLASFPKPCKLANFFDFAMARDGHGRATLSLDTDCGAVKAGLYHYRTDDDGKTWSTQPAYEPDAMVRADPVPDDEQPDAASETSPKRSIWRH